MNKFIKLGETRINIEAITRYVYLAEVPAKKSWKRVTERARVRIFFDSDSIQDLVGTDDELETWLGELDHLFEL